MCKGRYPGNPVCFQNCEVAVVTNVAADHIGLGGINSVEAMAKVKKPWCRKLFFRMAMLYWMPMMTWCIKWRTTWNAISPSLVWMKTIRGSKNMQQKMGWAVCLKNGYVTLMKGNWKIRVLDVKKIPLTFEGKAVHNINNCLPAVLSGLFFRDITIEDIRTGLGDIHTIRKPDTGPAELFPFKHFTIHCWLCTQPHGLETAFDFVSKMDYPTRIGIISGTGDRRDDDIRSWARYLHSILMRSSSAVIKTCGAKTTAEEIIGLLKEGSIK